MERVILPDKSMHRRILSTGELLDLASGASVDIVDGVRITGSGTERLNAVMHLACERGYTETVATLVDRGADESLNVDYLCSAAQHDWVELARYLISRGVDINEKSSHQICGQAGYTPLMVASSSGSVLTFDLLLECGADICLKTADDETALACAVNTINSRRQMALEFPETELQNYHRIIARLVELHSDMGHDVSWALESTG